MVGGSDHLALSKAACLRRVGRLQMNSGSLERYEVTVRIRDQGSGALNGRPLTLSGGVFENGGFRGPSITRISLSLVVTEECGTP
jgi:hypothetical protein